MALTVFVDSSFTRTTRTRRASGANANTTTTTAQTLTATRQHKVFANNEKENINPLTGLDSLESSKKEKSKPKVFGSSKANTNKNAQPVSKTFGASSKANANTMLTRKDNEATPKSAAVQSLRPRPITRSQSIPTPTCLPSGNKPLKQGPIAKKRLEKANSNVASASTTVEEKSVEHNPKDVNDTLSLISKSLLLINDEENTVSGRLLVARRRETLADRKARELTVQPLADLSEAFNLSHESIRPTEVEVPVDISRQAESEEEPNQAVDAFELMAALRKIEASNDCLSRLPAVLKTRGVKRSHDVSEFVKPSGRASLPLKSETPSVTPRPTKRVRKSLPPVPPNSPARPRSIPLPAVDNIIASQTDDGEEDFTQGSSHYSSLFGSVRGAADLSFEDLSQDFSFTSTQSL